MPTRPRPIRSTPTSDRRPAATAAGSLGAHIARLRGAAGISQGELSRRTGLSQPAISFIEGGRDPRADTVRRIAAALGVSVANLFGEAPSGDTRPAPEDAALLAEIRRAPPDVREQLVAYLGFLRARQRDAA